MKNKYNLTDQERLVLLQDAISNIRAVEFSYPTGSEERKMLYRLVVNNFSTIGVFSIFYENLKNKVNTLKKEVSKWNHITIDRKLTQMHEFTNF